MNKSLNERVPLMKSDDQLQTDAKHDFIRFYSHPPSLSHTHTHTHTHPPSLSVLQSTVSLPAL